MSWWYLSFADDGWLGACIVEGVDEMSAIKEAWRREINPGGQVLCGNLDTIDFTPPEEFCNKLLDKEDLKRLDLNQGGTGELGVVEV